MNFNGIDFDIQFKGGAIINYTYTEEIDVIRAMTVVEEIPTPVRIPVSCNFMGDAMDRLVIVTASYREDPEKEPLAGMTFVTEVPTTGRLPYLFG